MTNQREYIEHEVAALFDAIGRGDKDDALLTAITLQEVLHHIALANGDRAETCARITMENNQYRLPNRDRERAVRAQIASLQGETR